MVEDDLVEDLEVDFIVKLRKCWRKKERKLTEKGDECVGGRIEAKAFVTLWPE